MTIGLCSPKAPHLRPCVPSRYLEQWSVNFSCKGPDTAYVSPCRPRGFCWNYSAVVIQKQPVGFSDSDSKESTCSGGDPGSIPGSGRSPGEGNGYPLPYSSLENSMDRGAWQAIVHGVAKGRKQPSNFHFRQKLCHSIYKNKQLARLDLQAIVCWPQSRRYSCLLKL